MKHQETKTSGYGEFLNSWRKKRRFSQLTFSLETGVSARHISFLESGRARPSREMVLKLADSLEMPKAEINRALALAGFSAAYFARAGNDTETLPIRAALNHLLESHMPYPAIALDHLWNLNAGNDAATRLLCDAGFGGRTNLLEALASQTPEQSSIINWQETICLLLVRLQAEMSSGGNEPELRQKANRLAAHYEKHKTSTEIDRSQAVLSTSFRINGKVISVFSAIAGFGSVQDIVLNDMKVELMFPLDEVSKAYFSP